MEKSNLEKWEEVYYYLFEIGRFEPWDRFREKDTFYVVRKDTKEPIFFSFISDSAERFGVALYEDTDAYVRARARLRRKNTKGEPAFFLQDALVCLWGNREDVSKDNYDLIKALGLKFRGIGAWLHCESYAEGYCPVPLDDAELETLRDGLGNLMMMLKAVYEHGTDPHFEQGYVLGRQYSKEEKLYYTYCDKITLPDIPQFAQINVYENEATKALRDIPSNGMTVEMDWSYLPMAMKDEDGERVFPRLLLMVDAKSGYILKHELLTPSNRDPDLIFDIIADLCHEVGRPAQIMIGDRELEAVVGSFCNRIGIQTQYKSTLKQVNAARKELGRLS